MFVAATVELPIETDIGSKTVLGTTVVAELVVVELCLLQLWPTKMRLLLLLMVEVPEVTCWALSTSLSKV